MLKNIDFEKMSYEEGLALVAETRKNALKQGRVKTAGSMLDSLKQYWKDVPEEAKWSLYGAGAGGLGGLAASALTGKKKKKHYLRNMLTGGLLGGLAGYGGRLGYSALTDTPAKPDTWVDPNTQQTIAELAQTGVGGVGRGVEAAGLNIAGRRLGHAAQNQLNRQQLQNKHQAHSFHDRDAVNNAFDEIQQDFQGSPVDSEPIDGPRNPRTGEPQPKINANRPPLASATTGPVPAAMAELKEWFASATDADIDAAVKPGGRLHRFLPKGLVGSALADAASDFKKARGAGGKLVGWAKKLLPSHRGSPVTPKGGTGPALVGGKPLLSASAQQARATQMLVDAMIRKGKPSSLIGQWAGKSKLPTVLGLGLPVANLALDLSGVTNARPVMPSGKVPQWLQEHTPQGF